MRPEPSEHLWKSPLLYPSRVFAGANSSCPRVDEGGTLESVSLMPVPTVKTVFAGRRHNPAAIRTDHAAENT